jgi:4-amino-4-deoxy-L-arabinose transferase-like glycosyltransferase
MELTVLGTFLVALGCYLRGTFSRPKTRRNLLAALPVTLLIFILMLLEASGRNSSLTRWESLLLTPFLHAGAFLNAWLPSRLLFITAGGMLGIVLVSLLLRLVKKKAAVPFSLLLFAGGLAGLGSFYFSRGEIDRGIYALSLAALYSWLSALVSRKRTPLAPPGRWLEKTAPALLGGIILLGFLLRSYRLGEISFRFDHYESDYARQALQVLGGRVNYRLWTSTIWRGLGHLNLSPIYTYCVALSFRVFGVSLISLKLVPVTYGVFALLLTYGIFRTLFGKRPALLAAFFLAVSPLHINYSRIGLLLASTQTVSLLIVFLLLRAVLRRSYLSYLLLGTAACFAGYFYSPAKYPLLLAAFLITVYLFCKRGWILRHGPAIILMLLVVLLITLLFNLPTWGLVAPRFAGYESVWHRTRSHLYTSRADYTRALPLILENFRKLTGSFFLKREFLYDPWPRGNLYFNPLIPPLFILGLAYSLANFKKANYRLLLFFTAAFLVPNLLSRPPVMVRRMMVSWPFIYCLAAIPVSQLLLKSREIFSRTTYSLILGATLIGLLGMGAHNWYIFSESGRPAGRWEEERYFDEYAKKLLPGYHLYILPITGLSRKTLDFLLRQQGETGRGYEYISPAGLGRFGQGRLSPREPAALVVGYNRGNRSELNRLRRRLGRGKVEEVRTRFGRVVGYALLLPPGPTEEGAE